MNAETLFQRLSAVLTDDHWRIRQMVQAIIARRTK